MRSKARHAARRGRPVVRLLLAPYVVALGVKPWVGPTVGSDHLPLIAVLRWEGELNLTEQQPPRYRHTPSPFVEPIDVVGFRAQR